ncbi:MAG: hypothetical protein ACKVWV_19225 [Planctomycetota bacterium]
MKLIALDVRRLPGIDAPFGLASDLGARVTVVQGPNGSGKSSLCRALRALLWPKSEPSVAVDLAARFVHGEDELHVERHGSHVTWSRAGQTIRPPELPPDHLAACFTIAGDDLLGAELERTPRAGTARYARKDEALAVEIARELSGGFDLRALRSALAPPPRIGSAEERALREAQEDLARVTSVHARLHAEAQELEGLERDASAAEEALARARELETALELASVREHARMLAERLASFDKGMERLRGDELEQLRARRTQLVREREALRKADESSAEARATIAAANLPGEGLATAVLDAQKERVRKLAQHESEHRRAVSDEEAWRARREVRRRALDPQGQTAVDLAADRAALDALDAHVRRAQLLARRRAELDAQRAQVEARADAHDVDAIHAALRELATWLRSAPEPAGTLGLDRAGWSLLALIAVTSIVLGLWIHSAWLLLALVAVLVVRIAKLAAPKSARRQCEAAFVALAVAPPASWSEADVARRYEELQRERAQLELAREQHAHGERLRAAASALAIEERAHEVERARLREALGVDASASDLSLAVIAANLIAFQAAQEETAACIARREELEDRRAALSRTIARFLEPFGTLASDDVLALGAALEALERRAESARQGATLLRGAEAQKREAERRCGDVERSIDELFAAVALPRASGDGAADRRDDEIALARRLERLPEWRDVERQLSGARAQEAALSAKLRASGDADATTVALDEAQIRGALSAARAVAAGRDELLKRIQHIRTRVDQVRGAHDLEEALGRVAAAREALHERRERAIDDAVLEGLLAEVEEEERHTTQSPVFHRAKVWFAKFTHFAYELQLGAGESGSEPTFQAFETAAREVRSLDELSTGTRAQLLLAARIAFAIEAERGAKLPLFLDEALLAADPERFRAVADALALLAREEERQVIYLTSDPTDTARWQLIESDLAVVDLARVRKLVRTSSRPLAPLEFQRTQVEGLAPSEIASALGVGAPDPWQAPESVHVYHLVGADPARLQVLLDQHVETLGAVRALAHAPGGARHIEPAELARLEAWGEVFGAFVRAWRTGRGKPLTRDALEATGVTDTYLEAVAALAVELEGDGKLLVNVLRARTDARLRKMHKSTAQKIEEHLAAEGHYDAREVLSEEAIVERAIGAAPEGLLPAEIAARVKSWCRALEPQPARTHTMDSCR